MPVHPQIDPLVSFFIFLLPPHAELCLILSRFPYFENKLPKTSLTISYFEELQLHHRQARLV